MAATTGRVGKRGGEQSGERTRGVVRSTVLNGKIGLVEVHGYLTPREVAAIRNAIIEFEGRSHYCVALDVANVTGMNVLCLAHMVDQMWELRGRGGDLRLIGVHGALEGVLAECGAETLFVRYTSREEARRWNMSTAQ